MGNLYNAKIFDEVFVLNWKSIFNPGHILTVSVLSFFITIFSRFEVPVLVSGIVYNIFFASLCNVFLYFLLFELTKSTKVALYVLLFFATSFSFWFHCEVICYLLSDSQRLSLANKYLPGSSIGNNKFSRYILENNDIFIKKEILCMPCPEIFENVTVFNDGSIGLCCADINKKCAYGNVNVSGIKDLIFSEYFLDLRSKALKRELGICKKCSFPGSFLFNKRIKITV